MVTWRSPKAARSHTARRERPTRRWISWVRPDCLPAAASRRMRSWVERGSMPYSAVTQPLPEPFRKGGAFSSRLAVTSTWVRPNLTRQEPSAWAATPASRLTERRASAARLEWRMGVYILSGRVEGGRYLAALPATVQPHGSFEVPVVESKACL